MRASEKKGTISLPTSGLRHLIRKRFVSATYAEAVDLTGKMIIVTGATPGSLGFETARTLASWGASVVITTRSNPDAAARGASVAVAVRRCAPASRRARARPFVQLIQSLVSCDGSSRAHGDKLDVLINNAGIHLDLLSRWTEPHLSDDGFEIQWRTNYLGHRTSNASMLLPLLEKTGQATGDARIVNVVSHLYVKGSNEDLFERTRPYNSWTAYGNSKLALMHMTSELQRRYTEKSHVQAYCLHPGSVFTNVADKGLEGAGVIEKVRNALSPIEAFFLKTPEEGAQTQIHCATYPRLAGGLYYVECQPAEARKDAQDTGIAARLWAATEAWVEA